MTASHLKVLENAEDAQTYAQATLDSHDYQAGAGKEAVEGSAPADNLPPSGQSLSGSMSTHDPKPLSGPQQSQTNV